MLKYCSYFVLVFGLCAGDNLPQLNVGDTAPDFAIPDHNGKTRRLSDYRGGLVVVYFFPRADTPG
jgi:peroxiredoxin